MRGLRGNELMLHQAVFLRKAFAAMVSIDVDDGGNRSRKSGDPTSSLGTGEMFPSSL
jgi:hypothetical protein